MAQSVRLWLLVSEWHSMMILRLRLTEFEAVPSLWGGRCVIAPPLLSGRDDGPWVRDACRAGAGRGGRLWR